MSFTYVMSTSSTDRTEHMGLWWLLGLIGWNRIGIDLVVDLVSISFIFGDKFNGDLQL